MTILCLVHDVENGGWAAFADCLITSDEHSEGYSLRTPLRPNYESKATFGFSEVALEEKIGCVEDQMILGWAGKRAEAIRVLERIKARGSNDEISEIIADKENCYLAVQRQEDGLFRWSFSGPNDQVHRMQFGDYELFFAGSGSQIIKGTKFTARHFPIEERFAHVGWAAVRALSRFLAEELGGQTSQFYSLRTGGYYKIYYGSPKGIRQAHYSLNHWSMNEENEPVVRSITVPLHKNQYEVYAEMNVEKNWQMNFASAIALSPLLQSPRRRSTFEIGIADVVTSELSDFTFHVCWREDRHETFAVSIQEPQFVVSKDGYRKLAHEDGTIERVKEFLTGP